MATSGTDIGFHFGGIRYPSFGRKRSRKTGAETKSPLRSFGEKAGSFYESGSIRFTVIWGRLWLVSVMRGSARWSCETLCRHQRPPDRASPRSTFAKKRNGWTAFATAVSSGGRDDLARRPSVPVVSLVSRAALSGASANAGRPPPCPSQSVAVVRGLKQVGEVRCWRHWTSRCGGGDQRHDWAAQSASMGFLGWTGSTVVSPGARARARTWFCM